MKPSSKKVSGLAFEAESVDMPMNGVLTVTVSDLSKAGILFQNKQGVLSFWPNPDSNFNEVLGDAGIALCEACCFDGPESHVMYDAINRAYLNIRLIRLLQGR